jgi:hypothetical protein
MGQRARETDILSRQLSPLLLLLHHKRTFHREWCTMKYWLLCGLATMMASAVSAQMRVDLSSLEKGWAGSRTQILILGTVHLSEARDFKHESLEPVLDRLAAFKPQIITIEHISGEGCDLTARHPTVYPPEEMRTYCRDAAAAKEATGLDLPAAIAEVNRTLKNWPPKPGFVQRRHLAASFLAANDEVSANVQWLQLPETERHAGDGLNDELVTQLNKRAVGNDESYQIAARLAARLELQRVFAIDDHTGDNIAVADEAAYGKAIQAAWDGASAKTYSIRKRQDELWKSGDMLALYRYINSPVTLKITIENDFGAALREKSPRQYGRIYVAGWETRNLRMAANIHAAFRESPGTRVLSIVGSEHKPWLDKLLGQMQGVEIIDAEHVLK